MVMKKERITKMKKRFSYCLARIKRDDILVLLLRVVPCSLKNVNEINGRNCNSSSSSLSSLVIEQEEKDEQEESFHLFIFRDPSTTR